ncbi:GumC family protein [Acuticoccus mangrovi]|uniref:Polysaccharide chain length determinant N-terminal domain-containing protein n=1 Tax=Acuticoccus mangrovi TaxID=2796142 RepID=A0A934IR62_9HYPH|nr:exopolysaccharide transport family protein [Acuticoccus mangrovi]MBJ3778592.1 hypothetical protein [Acuticoccus mangrovi]
MSAPDATLAAVAEPRAPNPLNPILWLIEALWQYKWLIVTIMVAGVVAATLLASRLPNSYSASGLLEIDPQSEGVLRGQQSSSGYIPPETITETEVQVIQSTNVLSRVVDQLDLEYSQANPALRASAKDGPKSRASAESAIIDSLQRNLTVRPTGRSFVVEVSFEGSDPSYVADVVNAVMNAYLGVEVSQQRTFARDAITLLSNRLDELRTDLDSRERAVQDFRATSRIAEEAGTNILSEQLARLNEELVRAQASLATATAASSQRGAVADSLPEVVNSPLIQQLRAQAAVQERTVSELASLYRPSHPRLIQAKSALAALQDTIDQETQKIVSAIGTTETVEADRVAALQKDVDALRGRLNEQRNAEIELRRLEREVEASRKVYEAFLDRFNEVQGTSGLERPDGRIIASAVPPIQPSGPKRMLIVAGGGILSGGLAFALVIGLALIDSRMRTRADVTRATGLTPVAVMPPVPGRGGLLRRLGGRHRNAAFAEAITHLRAALVLGAGTHGTTVLAMTAVDTATGHAALAAALGQACAVSGDRAVIVDANVENPTLHTLLGGSNEYGLSEVVADRGDLDSTLQMDEASELMFIAAGNRSDPSLYRSEWMGRVLDLLYERFNVTILCLPPLPDLPDAQVLVSEADVTAIAVRAGLTDRSSLAELVAMLRFAGQSRRLATVLMRG